MIASPPWTRRSFLVFMMGFAAAVFLWTFFQTRDLTQTTSIRAQPLRAQTGLAPRPEEPSQNPNTAEPSLRHRGDYQDARTLVPSPSPPLLPQPIPSPSPLPSPLAPSPSPSPPPAPFSSCNCPVSVETLVATPPTYLSTKNVAYLENADYDSIALSCSTTPPDGHVERGVQCCGAPRQVLDPPVSHGEMWCNSSNSLSPNGTSSYDAALRAFSKNMASIRVPWHLLGFTLLSWHVRCAIANVYESQDLQIGIMEEDWNSTALKSIFKSDGFEWKNCYHYDKISWVWTVTYNTSIPGDQPITFVINQVMREPYYAWISYIEYDTHFRWDNYNIIPAMYKDIPIGIPDNIEKYLWLQFKNIYNVCPKFNLPLMSRNIHLYVPRWKRLAMQTSHPFANQAFCTVEGKGFALDGKLPPGFKPPVPKASPTPAPSPKPMSSPTPTPTIKPLSGDA